MEKLSKMKILVTYFYLLLFSGALKVVVAYSHLDSYNFETSQGTSSSIRIGLISDYNTEHLRAAFEFGILKANSDLSVPLVGITEEINYGNSLQANDKLCELMKEGIGGVFAPTAKHTAAHLMQICDDKDVPYIYPRMSDNYDGFNLFPHPTDVATALHSIISAFEWSRFIFLYESSNYHTILDGLMSFYSSNGPVISVVRYDLNLNGNYKPVLRRVRKSVDNRIVVVGSTPSVAELLKQAQQVGMINEDYKYIIGNLDFQTFDLEEFKYSEVNITGLRMFSMDKPQIRELIDHLSVDKYPVDYGNLYETDTTDEKSDDEGACPITIDMALTYDAIQVFAETTKHLIYNPQPLNCSDTNDNVQNDGSTFGNYMKSLDISEKTITGRIYFEGNIRKGYTFDVIELQESGIVKIGIWNEYTNLTIERPPAATVINEANDGSLVNKTFVVLISVGNKPYASLVETHKKLEGNNQYEGYGVDLISELADKLGFNFTLQPGGNDYGSFNKTTNQTTGMLKKIVEGEADLAITDLTITSEREEAIDFSIPFMNLGISILFIKPQKTPPALFSFMEPFSEEVWWYLGLAYLGVSLSFFILGRLSPTEWDNPYPCIEEPDELENQFTINNSLWFTTGALLQQGSEIAPKALSTRTIASIWWFFTLIMVSSYTANLAAFLTVENPTSVINNVQDLAENKAGVKYGAKRTGSTRTFFLTSEDETYKIMNEFMTNNPEFLTETNQEGVDRVNSGSDYAFLMESTSIEYNTVRECNLLKIGEPLDEKGYGIAMKKNWPYRDKFNNALLELQEQGVLAQIKNKWWNEIGAGVCDSKTDSGEASDLDMDNLGGVYFILIVGTGFSLVFGIVQWCTDVGKRASYYHVPFTAALVEEFKNVVNFSNNERTLKCATSVYSRSRNSSMSINSLETDSDKTATK